MTDIFVKQLDGCTYCPGGLNCTCACEAMWLFRASGGKIRTTSCLVRMQTGDKLGGTHLGQMEAVSKTFGITTGRIYRPIAASTIASLAATRRYGFIIQGSYTVLTGTKHDCFSGGFKGNHAWYVSGPGTQVGTWRVADPGADGRRTGIPKGYQDIPVSLMLKAAAALDVSDPAEPYRSLGAGKAYVYITPIDPAPITAQRFHASVIHPTTLWNDQTKRWVYSSSPIKVGTALIVRGATYIKGDVPCYPVDGTSPNYPGYYVPKANVKLGAKA